jgi:hypothetical protein
MKNPFAKFNAKSRQEFWLDLDEEDRIGIINLAQKDDKAALFLENIRMSENIDPDDAWVAEGLEYCEKQGGLAAGKSKSILGSIMSKREEMKEKVQEFSKVGVGAINPLLETVFDVMKQNNIDVGLDMDHLLNILRSNNRRGDK